jgi:aminopeptidase
MIEAEAFMIQSATTSRTFEEKIDLLAKVAVNVGLVLQQGQELILTAPLDSLSLVRRITEQAYRAGASLVTTLYSDDEATLFRYAHASYDSFSLAAGWLYEGMGNAFKNGAARMAISGANPLLLANEDTKKISLANEATSRASRPAMEYVSRHAINWTIVPCASPAWAKTVFPELPIDEAVAKLWDTIFSICRIDFDDPFDAWKHHDSSLQQRASYLNEKRYSWLHYKGPGIDFRLGLADDHMWLGGGKVAGNGVYCIPNIPTEEVFTTPHMGRAEGIVSASKPLSHNGTMVEDIRFRFERGRIVETYASKGKEVLDNLINTDDGSKQLGEVALVPHSSPIAASSLLFNNTLLDENAASHLALGRSYSNCIRGGSTMTREELATKGGVTIA